MEKVIVTRHPALVELLRERKLVEDSTVVLTHVTSPDEEIRGKHVFGVLPLELAALAAKVTTIPLALSPEDRGKELSLKRIREIAGSPATFQVFHEGM